MSYITVGKENSGMKTLQMEQLVDIDRYLKELRETAIKQQEANLKAQESAGLLAIDIVRYNPGKIEECLQIQASFRASKIEWWTKFLKS